MYQLVKEEIKNFNHQPHSREKLHIGLDLMVRARAAVN